MYGKVLVGMFFAMLLSVVVLKGVSSINTSLYYKVRENYTNAVVVDKYTSGGYRITDYTIVLDLDGDLSTADRKGYTVSHSVYNNTMLDK